MHLFCKLPGVPGLQSSIPKTWRKGRLTVRFALSTRCVESYKLKVRIFSSLLSSFTFLVCLSRLPQPLPQIFLPTLGQFFHLQGPPHSADLRLSIPLHYI